MIVTVGEVLAGARGDGILGIAERSRVLDYMRRALELAVYKAQWDCWLDNMDVVSDECGIVTLPSCVGTVLQVNVCGVPTIFRNSWYNFHINGFGDRCGPQCGFSNDAGWSPVFQDLREWSVLAALCEDPIDGNGSLEMVVQGETMDAAGNIKPAITIPVSGPSSSGVKIQLLNGVASTDSTNPTFFRAITQVTKPVTRGYVKLIAFPMRQMALSVTLGYYAPNETNPRYRRIKVGTPCKCVRIRYRRASIAMVNDWDIVPISSYEAMLLLLKSVKKSDANDIAGSEAYLGKAVRLLSEVQAVESGSTFGGIQVDPSWSIGTIAYW